MSTRKLTPTQVDVATSGEKDGKPWTLYKVAAVDDAGLPIDQTLKSFTNFKVGELIEVEVVRQEHEKYGVSYLLKPAGKGAGLKGSVDELRTRIERLESQVGQLLAGSSMPVSGVSQQTTIRRRRRPLEDAQRRNEVRLRRAGLGS